MTDLDKLDEVINMLGASISDVESCEEDFKYLDQDFLLRFPDYKDENLSVEAKKILQEIKEYYKFFRRRNFVKTVFSSIEGNLFAMNRILLEESNLTDGETIKLQEYEFIGPTEDKLRKKPYFLSMDENVKFVIRTFEKFNPKETSVDFNGDDWNNFKEAVKIRNRITHPKHSSDLLISENEIEIIRNSYHWFYYILNEAKKE